MPDDAEPEPHDDGAAGTRQHDLLRFACAHHCQRVGAFELGHRGLHRRLHDRAVGHLATQHQRAADVDRHRGRAQAANALDQVFEGVAAGEAGIRGVADPAADHRRGAVGRALVDGDGGPGARGVVGRHVDDDVAPGRRQRLVRLCGKAGDRQRRRHRQQADRQQPACAGCRPAWIPVHVLPPVVAAVGREERSRRSGARSGYRPPCGCLCRRVKISEIF